MNPELRHNILFGHQAGLEDHSQGNFLNVDSVLLQKIKNKCNGLLLNKNAENLPIFAKKYAICHPGVFTIQ